MIPAALLVPAIHEWVKALCSTMQGDQTPKNTGRLSLNPIKHMEPIGFMFILLFGFGWGRPVETATLHYKNRSLGVVITHTVPILINLVLGITAAIAVVILSGGQGMMPHAVFFALESFPFMPPDVQIFGLILLAHFAFININFALFNLIPIYPLATNRLLLHFSRPDTIARLNHYEKPMQMILILLLLFNLLDRAIIPITVRILFFAWGFIA